MIDRWRVIVPNLKVEIPHTKDWNDDLKLRQKLATDISKLMTETEAAVAENKHLRDDLGIGDPIFREGAFSWGG